jgi:hypothetical protein
MEWFNKPKSSHAQLFMYLWLCPTESIGETSHVVKHLAATGRGEKLLIATYATFHISLNLLLYLPLMCCGRLAEVNGQYIHYLHHSR